MRAKAYPGEDPATLKTPETVAQAIVELLGGDFETGHRLDLEEPSPPWGRAAFTRVTCATSMPPPRKPPSQYIR